jgi:hypothetical protein
MDQVGDGPVKLPDETALWRRLHEEIDLSDMRPAPVDAVFPALPSDGFTTAHVAGVSASDSARTALLPGR